MIKVFLSFLFWIISLSIAAQDIKNIINRKEVERIEKYLSSDQLKGRKIFTPSIDTAAEFIAKEFQEAGLRPYGNSSGFKQEFILIKPVTTTISASIEKQPLSAMNVIVVSSFENLSITEKSGYQKKYIRQGDNFRSKVREIVQSNDNVIVMLDPSFEKDFHRLNDLRENIIESGRSMIFILTNLDPQEYNIIIQQQANRMKLTNIVGILPGKSLNTEFVIFSGHYDHVGTDPLLIDDSIYNGANDDASGITAVIMLAKYFKALDINERTLVFAAFTGEEDGGFGSKYFSRQIDANKVIAMINIEMIGTESKWGKNSAFITGYEKSNLGEILQSNLKGSAFKFNPDPYPDQQLFYRSDNATLARLGVPAHTISTSKMDDEKFYHTVNDEVETLDLENMTAIIKAIALSTTSIIKGKEVPGRVNADAFR